MNGPWSGSPSPKRPSAAANGVLTPAGATTVVRMPSPRSSRSMAVPRLIWAPLVAA